MTQKTDYAAVALLALSIMITAALGTSVVGFQLPPVLVFALIVVAAPIPTVLWLIEPPSMRQRPAAPVTTPLETVAAPPAPLHPAP